MIKIEIAATPSAEQWMATIEGARNAMNSWDKSDSEIRRNILKEEEVCPGVTALVSHPCDPYISIGPNDLALMKRLTKAGDDHGKYARMLPIHMHVTAPLYWWKEFETYRIGVAPNPSDIEMNSCSTMHKIHAKCFEWEDFSNEHLMADPRGEFSDVPLIVNPADTDCALDPTDIMELTITMLNACREKYLSTKDIRYWIQMIQLLPDSYNQKRTLSFNYTAAAHMRHARKNHKLNEWPELCAAIESLPYSELITGEE